MHASHVLASGPLFLMLHDGDGPVGPETPAVCLVLTFHVNCIVVWLARCTFLCPARLRSGEHLVFIADCCQIRVSDLGS